MIDPATTLPASDTNGSHPDIVLKALAATVTAKIKASVKRTMKEGTR